MVHLMLTPFGRELCQASFEPGREMCPHTERHSGLAWASRGSWPLSTACPEVGPHGRLKSWLPWAQGDSCPRSPGQSDPWGLGACGR